MHRIAAVVVAGVPLVALAAACSKDPPPPATPVAVSAQPSYGQPPPGDPNAQAAPTAAPGQPAPPAPGQLSTPGPSALSCQNDSQCLTHRCNTQYQKCAFPCATDTDCIQGTTCIGAGSAAAICVPKAPGAQ